MSSHLNGLQQTEALVLSVVEPDLVWTRCDEQVTGPGVCAAKHLLVVVGNLDNDNLDYLLSTSDFKDTVLQL